MKELDRIEMAQNGDLIAFLKAGKNEHYADYITQGKKLAEEAITNKDVDYRVFVEMEKI